MSIMTWGISHFQSTCKILRKVYVIWTFVRFLSEKERMIPGHTGTKNQIRKETVPQFQIDSYI